MTVPPLPLPDIPWEEAKALIYEAARAPEFDGATLSDSVRSSLVDKWTRELSDGFFATFDGSEIPLRAVEESLGFEYQSWDEIMEFYRDRYREFSRRSADLRVVFANITGVRVLGPDVRPKHWPPGNTSLAEITAMVVEDGESRFFPGITAALLSKAFLDAVADHIDEIWPLTSHMVIDLDAMTIVGSSLQGTTRFVRFDWSFDTCEAHAYPVDAADTCKPIVYNDSLQGYVKLDSPGYSPGRSVSE